jgi:hypothetical protein
MRQGGGRRAAAVALILWVRTAGAADVEVTPRNTSTGPVVVSAGTEDTIYYPLNAGTSLEYLAKGPTSLVLQTRLRISAGRKSASGVVQAYGDGEFRIPDIAVTGRGVADGAVFDARGGVPSDVVLSTIEIPAGGTSLTIRAPSRGPDFLVRVVAHPAAEPVEAPPVALATIETPPAAPIVPAEPSRDLVLSTAPACADATLPVSVSEAQVASEPRSILESHPIEAGPELGLGAPARGDSAVFYWGVQGRIAALEDVIDATLSVGSYRVGVLETHQVDDPYAGPVTVAADYHTTVVPVEIAGLYRVPMILFGIVHPFAGAGASLDFTRRVEGDDRSSGVGVGTVLLGGVDIDVGPGQLDTAFGWNGVRHDFGNVNAEGEPVRETFATVRLDVAWLYAF